MKGSRPAKAVEVRARLAAWADGTWPVGDEIPADAISVHRVEAMLRVLRDSEPESPLPASLVHPL